MARVPALDLVTIGHILKETVVFPDRRFGPVLGSPAAYCSVTAARLGARVGIVSRVGPDMPRELLAPFQDVEVDTKGLHAGPATTTTDLVYDTSGRKELRYRARAAPIRFEDIPPAYRSSRSFHICPMDYEVSSETVTQLATLGGIISIDLGGFGGAHASTHPDPQEQRHPRVLADLLRHAEIVRASVEDCEHLFGAVPDDRRRLALRFLEWGARVGIVTLGSDGVVAATTEGAIRVPSIQGRVVDATGAGDAFCAGFLVAYLREGDVASAARFASAVALHVIQGTGGVVAARMPTWSDVEHRLATGRWGDAEGRPQ